MFDSTYPRIRLKPKTRPQAIRHGYPWIYDNELVTDRRTKAIPAGSFAILQDEARQDIAIVTVNLESRIAARVMDLDPSQQIDAQWLRIRVQKALSHRETLYDQPYYRLIHAEADSLPGVVVDRFGDVLVLQPNAAWADRHREDLADVLVAVTGATSVIMNGTGRTRKLEGLEEETLLMRGAAPEAPIPVPMNGAVYMADVMGGQKTGLFFDQRDNHAFAARLAKGARVLDVFSHVGGFALAALAGGAASALSIDASAAALALAQDGATAMGHAERLTTRQGDAFGEMNTLAQDAATFDLVICDPPAFAPNKQALEPGLRAYEKVARHAAPLVAEGGYLVLCSCSHAADLQKFRGACLRGIGRAGRRAQLIHTGFAGPDHPLLPQLPETGYLKALVFRL